MIGEDLGTVPPGTRTELRRRHVLSYRLLWFENSRPEDYPAQALAAVTTHDLFTIAGLWTGSDLQAQENLGLHPNREGMEVIRRKMARLTGTKPQEPVENVILKVHRALKRAPSRFLAATLDDVLGVEKRPNMPGTTTEWPNWRLALPKTLEEIRSHHVTKEVAEVLARPPAQTEPGS